MCVCKTNTSVTCKVRHCTLSTLYFMSRLCRMCRISSIRHSRHHTFDWKFNCVKCVYNDLHYFTHWVSRLSRKWNVTVVITNWEFNSSKGDAVNCIRIKDIFSASFSFLFSYRLKIRIGEHCVFVMMNQEKLLCHLFTTRHLSNLIIWKALMFWMTNILCF